MNFYKYEGGSPEVAKKELSREEALLELAKGNRICRGFCIYTPVSFTRVEGFKLMVENTIYTGPGGRYYDILWKEVG